MNMSLRDLLLEVEDKIDEMNTSRYDVLQALEHLDTIRDLLHNADNYEEE